MGRILQERLSSPQGIILEKKRLAPLIWELLVSAPVATHNCKPGQFVGVIEHAKAQRRSDSGVLWSAGLGKYQQS